MFSFYTAEERAALKRGILFRKGTPRSLQTLLIQGAIVDRLQDFHLLSDVISAEKWAPFNRPLTRHDSVPETLLQARTGAYVPVFLPGVIRKRVFLKHSALGWPRRDELRAPLRRMNKAVAVLIGIQLVIHGFAKVRLDQGDLVFCDAKTNHLLEWLNAT